MNTIIKYRYLNDYVRSSKQKLYTLNTSIEKNCKFLKNNRLVSTAIFDDTIIFPEKQNVGL